MALDTLFLCFCEDICENNGTTKPYFMRDTLKVFISYFIYDTLKVLSSLFVYETLNVLSSHFVFDTLMLMSLGATSVSCLYGDLWHPDFQLKVLSLSSIYDVCYAENE